MTALLVCAFATVGCDGSEPTRPLPAAPGGFTPTAPGLPIDPVPPGPGTPISPVQPQVGVCPAGSPLLVSQACLNILTAELCDLPFGQDICVDVVRQVICAQGLQEGVLMQLGSIDEVLAVLEQLGLNGCRN